MTSGRDAVPDWLLERYRLGELAAAEQRQVEHTLAQAELQARLEALDRSSDSVLREHPPAAIVEAVRRARPRGAAGRGRRRRRLVPLAAVVVTASVAGLLIGRSPTPTEPEPDVTRVKGITPYLLLYRKAAPEAERLAPAALVRQHDVVQLAYQAGGRRYGVIVSMDGRGVLTRHLPVSGAEAVPLTAGAPVPLAQSYELDDAPGFERFVLVAADQPFAVSTVEAALRRQHAARGAGGDERRLDLPDSMDQFSLVIRK
jgi:hypothetical protein